MTSTRWVLLAACLLAAVNCGFVARRAPSQEECFLLRLRLSESSLNWTAVNGSYVGHYQLGRSALKDVGVKVSLRAFARNPRVFGPEAQKAAVVRLLALNQRRLSSVSSEWVGREWNGVRVSTGGLLAAAHLVGAGAVKKWFAGGKEPRDANDTGAMEYMRRFSRLNPDFRKERR